MNKVWRIITKEKNFNQIRKECRIDSFVLFDTSADELNNNQENYEKQTKKNETYFKLKYYQQLFHIATAAYECQKCGYIEKELMNIDTYNTCPQCNKVII